MDDDQKKVEAKEKEKEVREDERKRDKEESEKDLLQQRKMLFGHKEPKYYSRRMIRFVGREERVRKAVEMLKVYFFKQLLNYKVYAG